MSVTGTLRAARRPGPQDAPTPRPAGDAPASPPRWWREVLLVGLLYGAYELSRGLAHADLAGSVAHGKAILDWERAWHLSPERLLNRGLDAWTPAAVVASYLYATLHYLVTPAVLVWMFRCHPGLYRRARTALAFGTAFGLTVFFLLPTAPPRLLAGSGVHDTLALVHHWGWWGGDGSVPRGMGGLTNQFAAMPSLHVGWALWCGVLLARHAAHRWLRALGVLYPLVMGVVVLATGNHYLVDVVAGAAVMVAGAGAAAAATVVARRVRSGVSAPRPA